MFRSLGKSKIAFVLAILFGISLFFFRSGDRYSNFFNSDSIVASVSGTPISTTKFNKTLQMNINNFNQMLNKKISTQEIKAFNIASLSLSSLINNAVFENEYDKINLKIDETIIAQNTKKQIPQLYDNDNKLDQSYLNSFLQTQQLKIEDIVQIIDFETRDQYFKEAFFNINFPKYFIKKIDKVNEQEREISYLKLPIEKIDIKKIIKKNLINEEEDLLKFYNENIQNYMNEEKRDIEYVLIDKKDYSANFTPDNFEIEDYYSKNKELFFEDEKRSFIQFNFKTIKEAEDFQLITNNFNFNKIVNYAEDNNIRFNRFENMKSNEILTSISDALFKLKKFEKTEIIKSSLANHIIILESIEPGKQLKIQDVKEEIIKTISEVEIGNFYNNLLNEISQQILDGNTIQNIANNFNLQIKNINNLTKNYKNEDLRNKIFLQNLISNSFASNKDFVSDIIIVDEDSSFFFNVNNIIEKSPIIFDKVKNEVKKDWEVMIKKIEIKSQILENINNKKFIKELNNQYDININYSSLRKNSDQLPNDFIKEIFKSEKAQNFHIYNKNKDEFLIGNLEKIIIAKKINQENSISLTYDLHSSFGKELVKNKKISINENLINAIIEKY